MSGSYFALNQKFNAILSLLASGNLPPYPPAADVMTTNTAQTVTAVKTFSILPESSVVPTTNDQLVNKAYVDGLTPPTPTLQDVLDAGSIAIDDSITLQSSTITGGALTLSPTSIDLAETSGTLLLRNEQTVSNIGVKTTNGITNDYTQTKMNSTTGLSVEYFNGTLGSIQTSTVVDTDSITMANALGGAYSSDVIIENPTTFSQAVVNFDAVGVATAEAKLKSQSNQTEYSTSVVDTGNNLSASKSLITIGGAVLNTDTATNSGTGVVATSTSNTAWALGANTSQIFNTGSGVVNSITTTCDATVASQQNQYKTTGVDEYTTGISASNGSAGFACSYQDDAGTALNLFNTIANPAGASAYVQASNFATGSAHLLRLETPYVGGAVIEHQVVGGASRNLTLSTSGNLLMTSDNLNVGTARIDLTDQAGTPSVATIFPTTIQIVRNDPSSVGSAVLGGQGRLTLTSAEAGGTSNASLQLNNTGATGPIYMEVYKNKPTVGANGDVLFQQSVFGKDTTLPNGTKQEYTRITHTIRDATAGAEDGSMELGCVVNGGFANFIQLNANDSPIGEINFTRPLDFIGGSDANATIKLSGIGSNDLNINASTSAGTGHINLTSKTGTVLNVAGNININASASTGNGNIIITPKATGHLTINNLPTSSAGLPAGAIWNNGGVLNVVP